MNKKEVEEACALPPDIEKPCPIQREGCSFCEMRRDMREAIEKDDKPRVQLWANRRLEFVNELRRRGMLSEDEGSEECEQIFRSIIDGTENRFPNYHCLFRVSGCPFCVDMPREIHLDPDHRKKWCDRIALVMGSGEMPLDAEERRRHIIKVLANE